jgi:LysM repeat protein
MNSPKILKYFFISFIILSLFPTMYGVQAQTETGYDLITAVNALRASYGLEPYTIDPWIMDYAQQHTQHQADTQTSTHLHSDGTTSLSVGLKENVAAGDYGIVTIAVVINSIWVDWGHLKTMIGYLSGEAGAGIAVDADDTIYYTLNVRPGEEVSETATLTYPTAAFIPLITNTPDQNGAIYHIVESGETLWSIAVSYGVTTDSIRSMNVMPIDATTVYVGQKLLIRLALLTSTIALTTSTAIPTRTPTKPLATPSHTPQDIPTPSKTVVNPERAVVKMPFYTLILSAGIGAGVLGIIIALLVLLKKRR